MVRLMAVRKGISHFLEVVILVGLVGTLGMLIYSGALDLFAGWGDVKQVTIQSTYELNNTLYVIVSNKGSTAVDIASVSVYSLNGSLIGSVNTPTKIAPGKVSVFTMPLTNATLQEGDLVDIVISTEDGSAFKFRVAVQ